MAPDEATVQPSFADPAVAAVFAAYPDAVRPQLLALRRLIFETAAATDGVGALQETLKWGEPAYLTPQSKSGSTIRLNWKAALGENVAIYFKCTTPLVSSFKARFPETFTYEGNRAILLDKDAAVPEPELRRCIEMALTYHWIKDSLKAGAGGVPGPRLKPDSPDARPAAAEGS